MKRFDVGLVVTLLLIILVGAGWLGFTQQALQTVYRLGADYLPPGLRIAALEGRLVGPLTIRQVSFQPPHGVAIDSPEIKLDWSPWALLQGQLKITSISVSDLSITLADEPASPAAPADAGITPPQIDLPFSLHILSAEVRHLRIRQPQQQRSQKAPPQKEPVKDIEIEHIELAAALLFNHLSLSKLNIQAAHYSAHLSGELELSSRLKHHLKADWQWQLAGGKTLNGAGSLQGNVQHTRLRQTLSGAVEMSLDARLQELLKQLIWQADVAVQSFDTQSIDPGWPALSAQLKLKAEGDLHQLSTSGSLSGQQADTGPFDSTFKIHWLAEQSLHIEQLHFNAEKTATELDISGRWTPDFSASAKNPYGQTELDLRWQQLKWPQTGAAGFNSPTGSARLTGNPESYQFTLFTERPLDQLPPSQWTVQGHGNLSGLDISELDIKTLDGTIKGAGKLSWSPRLSWTSTIDARHINPGRHWPDWPGQLNAHLTNRGDLLNDELVIRSDISRLHGQLRDYALDLTAKADWNDQRQQLDIKHFKLTSAQSVVTLNGQLGDSLALDWSLDSPDLKQLMPTLGGQLQARGAASGSLQHPQVSLHYQAKDLVLADISAAQLKGSATLWPNEWLQSRIQLDASTLNVQGNAVKSLQLNVDEKKITLQLKADVADISLALNGQVQSQQWLGRLSKVDISSQLYGHWKLQRPTDLTLSTDSIKADGLCLQQADHARLCSDLQWSPALSRADLKLQDFPLQQLQPWLADNIQPQGTLNGSAEFSYQSPQAMFGRVQLQSAAGVLHFPELAIDNSDQHYQDARFDIKIDDQGITLDSAMRLNETDSLQAQARLAGARLLELSPKQAIEGQLQLDINDINGLAEVIPEISNAHGKLTVKLNADGDFQQPRMSGHIRLEAGSFNLPRADLKIKKVNLLGTTASGNQLNIEASAQSGDGNLRMLGTLHYPSLEEWSARITVNGKNFSAVHIPEAEVEISPNLQVDIRPYFIDISGDVHVPHARLNPKDTTSAVHVSDDVVIINSQLPPEKKWWVQSKVRITLDPDHVYFYGFGFEGKIGGNLEIEDSPDKLTSAVGEITVAEGRYEAYGQRLAVKDGRLLFSGGPIDNPGLDFRAIRQVNEVTAGVKVSGTLHQPTLDLFSVPAMSQTDALAYLILGRSMETSNSGDGEVMAKAALALGLTGGDRMARALRDRFGLDDMRIASSNNGEQASLVLGRYLSPRLYISYGVGLIESINTFSIRYQINDKWQLKAESEGDAQGADLLYTLER